jgi:uncharacterized membrane protein
MPTLSIKECLRFGWETFKKRPWVFVGAGLIVFLIEIVLGLPEKSLDGSGAEPVYQIVTFVASLFIQMGMLHFILRAHDSVDSVHVRDLWHPKPFWRFLGGVLLTTLAVIAGLILLIVPGIIVSVALTFTLYLVIDRGLGPVNAMKESWRLTKGKRWKLFGFLLAILGINLLGLLAVFVGLIVTIPVTMLAMAHAFRILSAAETTETPQPVPAPAA